MRKIDRKYEDFFDNIFIDITEYISPFLYATGHTPNILTTYSLLLGLLSSYFLYNDNLLVFVILYLIAYFFDCADGHFARKYKMSSKYGDLYDHGVDITKNITLFLVVIKKYYKHITIMNVLVLILFFIIMLAHLGCTQKII